MPEGQKDSVGDSIASSDVYVNEVRQIIKDLVDSDGDAGLDQMLQLAQINAILSLTAAIKELKK